MVVRNEMRAARSSLSTARGGAFRGTRGALGTRRRYSLLTARAGAPQWGSNERSFSRGVIPKPGDARFTARGALGARRCWQRTKKGGGCKDRRSYLEAGRSGLDTTPSGRWLAEMEGEVQSPPPRDTGIPPQGQCLSTGLQGAPDTSMMGGGVPTRRHCRRHP